MLSPEENLQMWSSMSGAEAIASLLSNPPLAQHLATYARMMAEPDALALLRTVQLGSVPLCNLAQVCPCPAPAVCCFCEPALEDARFIFGDPSFPRCGMHLCLTSV
jgi:hypothetical protein